MNTSTLAPKKQQGMTALGWLIVLMLVAFFSLIVIRMQTVVFTHMEIKSALETLATDPDARKLSNTKLRDLFQRRLEIDGVEIVNSKNLVILKHRNGSKTLKLDYEHRVLFAKNFYIVAVYNLSAEIN